MKFNLHDHLPTNILLSLCTAPVSENSLGYAQHTIHVSEKHGQTRSNQMGEADKQAAVAITARAPIKFCIPKETSI